MTLLHVFRGLCWQHRVLVGTICTILAPCSVFSQPLLCPNQPSTEDSDSTALTFDPDPPSDLDFVCPRASISLQCCMDGFTRVEWYEYIRAISMWKPFIANMERYPVPDDNQQTLRIDNALKDRDATNFSCVGYDHHGNTIRNNITLHILDCNEAEPSTFLKPAEQNTTVTVTVGAKYHIECLVKFDKRVCRTGCNVWWYRYYNETFPYMLIDDFENKDNVTSRIYYVETKRSDTLFVSATLYIDTIEPEDLTYSYRCDGSGAFIEGDGARDVRLVEREIPQTDASMTLLTLLLVVILCFIGAVFCVMFLIWWYRVKICINYKTKVKKRQYNSQDYQYNVMVMYNSESREDREFTHTQLEPGLKPHFNIFSMNDINYGASILEGVSDTVNKASVILFVVSPELFEDGVCKCAIRDTLNTHQPTIYVIRHKIPKHLPGDEDILTIIRTGCMVKVRDDHFDRSCFRSSTPYLSSSLGPSSLPTSSTSPSTSTSTSPSASTSTSPATSTSCQNRDSSSEYWMLKLRYKIMQMLEKEQKRRQRAVEETQVSFYEKFKRLHHRLYHGHCDHHLQQLRLQPQTSQHEQLV